MDKRLSTKKILLPIVLASTIFAAQQGQANFNITIPVSGPITSNGVSDNTIQIAPSGLVTNINGDGVVLNSTFAPGVFNGGTLIIDPSNIHSTAITVASLIPNVYSIRIAPPPALPGAVVLIGSASNVFGADQAAPILVNNANATINNAGSVVNLSLGLPTIEITNIALGTVINNELSGTIIYPLIIQNVGGVNILSDAGATKSTLTLINAGQITQLQDADNIQLKSPFTAIINNAGGTIVQNGDGDNIHIIAGGGGDIINNLNATINNTKTGTVIFTNAGVSIGQILNAGQILNTGIGNAITLNGNANVINNSGTIDAVDPNQATIFVGTPGVTILNGLINSGNILNGLIGGIAIDFQTNLTHASVTQNGGAIVGNVLLAATDSLKTSNVFTMTGGLIGGNVIGGSVQGNTFDISGGTISNNLIANGGPGNNLFNLSGGAIGNTLFLGAHNDVVNLSGTELNQVVGSTGNYTVNITGGNFNALIGGVGGGNVVNVNATFETWGSIFQFATININNRGTVFTAHNTIQTRLFTINEGTTYVPDNLTTFEANGSLENFGTLWVKNIAAIDMFTFTTNSQFINEPTGTLRLNPNSKLTLLGGTNPNLFIGSQGSVINPIFAGPMGGPALTGMFVVDSTSSGAVVNLNKGSFIQPQFSGFIPNGGVFELIRVNTGHGAHIVDNSTLIQPPSATVFFTKELIDTLSGPDTLLILTSHRNSFSSLSTTPVTQGITGLLDILAQGSGTTISDLFTLITLLDQIPSDLEPAFESLIPPFNWGLIEGSHIGMDIAFEGVTDRVWDVAWHHKEHGRRHSQRPKKNDSGINQGDYYPLHNTAGIWLRPFGAYADQGNILGVPGYKAKAVGGAIGADWGATECTTVGIAGSYTNVTLDDKNQAPKNEFIKSWQGTIYGSFDLIHGVYLDAMAGLASNKYDQNRVIAVNTLHTAAQASFKGNQWGLQTDIGMALSSFDAFLAPFVRLKYIHLEIDDYTEEGALGLSLQVQNDDANELLAGVGLRYATDVSGFNMEWVPEVSALIAYDIINDGEQTIANFIAGGPAFETHGITPGRTIFDFGLAINALYGPNMVFTGKYNLELRNHFVSNAGYLQYFYSWS